LVLVLNYGNGLLTEGANRLSVCLEPHLETDCVEHVSTVTVELTHLVLHSILLKTDDALINFLICCPELLPLELANHFSGEGQVRKPTLVYDFVHLHSVETPEQNYERERCQSNAKQTAVCHAIQ
jgi:hypothetical protein